MRFSKSNTISTTHDSEKNLFQIQFKRNVTLKDLIKTFSAAIRCARDKKIEGWILDISKIPGLSEKSEFWFNTTLFPNMMIRFGTDNYIGIIMSDEEYQRRLQESGPEGLQSYNSFIKINTFTSGEKARQWIVDEKRKNNPPANSPLHS